MYNILASVAVSETIGLYIANYTNIFKEHETQIARMEEFDFGKPVILNLAKNPAGFNQAISAVKNDTRKKAVIIGINNMANDGLDVSWLYDVDFEKLDNMCAYGVTGTRKYDMALRLYYSDVCEKPRIFENAADGAMEFLRTEAEVVYLLLNYSMIFKAEKDLKKKLKLYKREHGIKEEKI